MSTPATPATPATPTTPTTPAAPATVGTPRATAVPGVEVPPDVTVVVPVFNTMPYLRRCLASLAEQTIGPGRMEVVAVDDGSTDGSDAELGRFARRHPGMVRVLRQPNSGGPAGPCNRALEVATGRYVFFLGADDYLGPDAMRRLVDAGDRYGSDVVLGRVVGVNSRFVHQEVFARDEASITLADSPLPWSLTNVKLFRHELVQRHHLRFPEDMPLGSDLPFTLAACYRAGRISVVAGYDCYYAVRRLNARNITHLSDVSDRLTCARQIVDFTTDLMAPGKERDAVLARVFGHEIAGLLRDDLLGLDRVRQQQVYDEVGRIAERHLTGDVEARLDIETRLRLAVVRRGSLDHLLAMIHEDAERGVPPTTVSGGRWYAAYPGFHTAPAGPPRDAYDVTDRQADWLAKLDVIGARWERVGGRSPVLALTLRSPCPDLTAFCEGPVQILLEDVFAEARVTETGVSTLLRADIPVDRVLTASSATGQRRTIQARLSMGGRAGSALLRSPGPRSPGPLLPRPLLRRRGSRLYAVTPAKDPSGRLMLSVVPVTLPQITARLTARLTHRRA